MDAHLRRVSGGSASCVVDLNAALALCIRKSGARQRSGHVGVAAVTIPRIFDRGGQSAPTSRVGSPPNLPAAASTTFGQASTAVRLLNHLGHTGQAASAFVSGKLSAGHPAVSQPARRRERYTSTVADPSR
ncbi:uncharacterized protein TRAVEDRAFT_51468 [Trametes versicolor FP-101664 SS1]|uniref:uncharacterized protein n=1 Tax=Trametes versicolor (strain FP-101664) TaxID=717944 RepID=UPI00046234EE|nr:uncharacterized protein TRAVEDRAFT_51468 [Trametes versicolor FP-101664 SS1]EIW55343.1 hypothetical protein TRAVEDRAFT_51468 [Trametes versicolor FP-101664 SS1]